MSDAPTSRGRDELEGTEAPFVSHLVELRDRLIRALIAVGVAFGVLALVARAGAAVRPAGRAAGGQPAGRRDADRHQRDLAVHGAAEDHAAGRLPGGAAGGAVPGVGLRRAGPVQPREEAWCCRWWSRARCCSSWAWRSATSSSSARCSSSSRASRRRASPRRRTSRPTSSFVMTMFIAFGAAFEVPVAVVVLARLGVVTHRAAEEVARLLHRRRLHRRGDHHAARRGVPAGAGHSRWCLLYEFGIWSARLFIKHTKAPDTEAETKPRRRRPEASLFRGAALRLGPLRHRQVQLQCLRRRAARQRWPPPAASAPPRAPAAGRCWPPSAPAIDTTTSPGRMPPRLAGPSCSTPVISTPCVTGRLRLAAISGVRSRGSTPIQPRVTWPSRSSAVHHAGAPNRPGWRSRCPCCRRCGE